MKKIIVLNAVMISIFVRAGDLDHIGIERKMTELKDRITLFNQYAELVEHANFTSGVARNESIVVSGDYERIEHEVDALRGFIRSQNNASLAQRLAELDMLAKQAEEHQRKAMEALAKTIGEDHDAD